MKNKTKQRNKKTVKHEFFKFYFIFSEIFFLETSVTVNVICKLNIFTVFSVCSSQWEKLLSKYKNKFFFFFCAKLNFTEEHVHFIIFFLS